MSPRTIGFVFDYAAVNPEAFILMVRELHGTMPAVREALQRTIADVAEEMVEDVLFLDAFKIELDTLREISLAVVQQGFYLTLEVLEHPERREEILQRAVRFIDRQFAGALAMQAMQVNSLAEMLDKEAACRPNTTVATTAPAAPAPAG